jgi:hypothetical protein
MDDECGGMGERGVDERSGISTLTLTLRCSGVRNRGGVERGDRREGTILVFPLPPCECQSFSFAWRFQVGELSVAWQSDDRTKFATPGTEITALLPNFPTLLSL